MIQPSHPIIHHQTPLQSSCLPIVRPRDTTVAQHRIAVVTMAVAVMATAMALMACAAPESAESEFVGPVAVADIPIRPVESYTFEMGEFLLSTMIEQDRLEGTGIIDQLPFTGDQLSADPVEAARQQKAIQGLIDMGLVSGVDPEQLRDQSIALVKVIANYPRQRTPGARFDIIVVAIGNAAEIKFGRLTPIRLFDTAQTDTGKFVGLTIDAETLAQVAEEIPLPDEFADVGTTTEEAQAGAGDGTAPKRRAAAYWVRNGGYLVRPLSARANSDAVLVLSLSAYNSDLFDGMAAAIRQRYPFDITESQSGIGGGRMRVRVASNFAQTTRDVLETIRRMTFTVRPRTPIVVFDNRERNIQIVRGPIRLQKRWMATAHVPTAEAAENTAAAANDPDSLTFSSSRRDDSAPGMRRIPYIITEPSESSAEFRRTMDDTDRSAHDRLVRHLAGADRLHVITWPNGPDRPEKTYDLPRNDLATILAFLRDELGFQPATLKQFCLDAVKGGHINAFVFERLPRQILSADRVLTYFPDTQRLAVGTEMVPGIVVDGAAENTWDIRFDAEFGLAHIRKLGPFIGVIEGNRFAWQDHAGHDHTREIRLSDATLETIFRARVEMVVADTVDPTTGRVVIPDAIEQLSTERDLLPGMTGISDPIRLARFSRLYDAKIAELRRTPMR